MIKKYLKINGQNIWKLTVKIFEKITVNIFSNITDILWNTASFENWIFNKIEWQNEHKIEI